MLSKLTSPNALQIKISFATAYDFNQLIHAICSPPRRFWPPPRPARPVDFWPCPSLPCPAPWKNCFPVHPWYLANKPGDYFAYLEKYLVASRQRYMNSCSPLPSAWDKVRIVKWQNWWGNKYMLIQVLWVCCFEKLKRIDFQHMSLLLPSCADIDKLLRNYWNHMFLADVERSCVAGDGNHVNLAETSQRVRQAEAARPVAWARPLFDVRPFDTNVTARKKSHISICTSHCFRW